MKDKNYIFIKGGFAEMLIHEMSSGEKFLKVIVADVNCDGHADGRPESRYNPLLLFDRM